MRAADAAAVPVTKRRRANLLKAICFLLVPGGSSEGAVPSLALGGTLASTLGFGGCRDNEIQRAENKNGGESALIPALHPLQRMRPLLSGVHTPKIFPALPSLPPFTNT